MAEMNLKQIQKEHRPNCLFVAGAAEHTEEYVEDEMSLHPEHGTWIAAAQGAGGQ